MSSLCSQLPILIDPLKKPYHILYSPTSHLIKVMSCILSELIEETGRCFKPNPSVFNCKTPPKISIKRYLERFEVYGRCSQECFVLALIYMDRIIEH